MEGKKKLGLPSVVATGVGVIVATSCLLSVGHFLRTVQYMPVGVSQSLCKPPN